MINKILDCLAKKIVNKINSKTIERIEVFEIRASDTICFLYPGNLGPHAEPFTKAAKKMFPNNEVIILEDGMRFEVITMDEQSES